MEKIKAFAEEWCWICPKCGDQHWECFSDDTIKECCETKFEIIYNQNENKN